MTMPLLKDLCHLLQVAVAPDADRVHRPVPPPDAPAVRRLPHARRPHRAVPAKSRLMFALRAFYVSAFRKTNSSRLSQKTRIIEGAPSHPLCGSSWPGAVGGPLFLLM